MAEDVVKLPLVNLEVPKPKRWDLAALLALIAAVVVSGFNLSAALGKPAGEAISGSLTAAIVVVQLVILSAALLVLGKTAKEGTLWGNLTAVAALLVGMSGVLLAAALWSVA